MCTHYLIEPVTCTPASGWEKGQVENPVGLVRERFFTPLLRLAAEQGDFSAQWSLAGMYVTGKGVRSDLVVAHMWLNLAASSSPYSRDGIIEERNRIAAKMTPAQITETQTLARQWKPK